MIDLYADVQIIEKRKDPVLSDLIKVTIIGLSRIQVNVVTRLTNHMDDQSNADDCDTRLQIITRDDLKYTLWNLQRLLKYAFRDNDVVINFELDETPMVLMPDGIEYRSFTVAVELGDMTYADWLIGQENILNIEARSYHIGTPDGEVIVVKGLTHGQAHQLNIIVAADNPAKRWVLQQDSDLALQTTDPLDALLEMHTALKRIEPDRDVVIRYSDGDPLGGISVITPDGIMSRMHANRPNGIIEAIENTIQVTPADG